MSRKKVLSKFTILCWAAFIAILGHMRPTGCGLDTPAWLNLTCPPIVTCFVLLHS